MTKNILFALAIAVVYMSNTAHAKRLYGTAGCGLGNMVFGKENQVLAATTNGTSYSQLFGITTGTSNCVDAEAHASIPVFIESNKLALANDMARGQGTTLSTLSEVMGCQNTGLVSSTLQKNYGSIFPSGNVSTDDVTNTIVDIIKTDSTLSADCKNVT